MEMCTTLKRVHVLESLSLTSDLLTAMTAETRAAWDSLEGHPDEAVCAVGGEFKEASVKYRKALKESIEAFKRAESELVSAEEGTDRLRNMATMVSQLPGTDSKEGMDAVFALQAFAKSELGRADVQRIKEERDRCLCNLKVLSEASNLHRFIFAVPVCPICMNSQANMMLPCGHTYCKGCLDEITRQSSQAMAAQPSVTCAMCRCQAQLSQARSIYTEY